MGHSASGTAASEAGPAGQQQPGTVRLAGMLTLSCLISQTGQATVTFSGELDYASADQACGYVRGAIDAYGGQVLLDVAGLSFCDAYGLGALVRISRHAGQAGSSLHLVAPPPRLMKIIRITGLEDKLPVHRADQAGHVQVARAARAAGHRRQWPNRQLVRQVTWNRSGLADILPARTPALPRWPGRDADDLTHPPRLPA